jgi:hypothetical protein
LSLPLTGASVGRSANWAADENTRERIRTVATRAVIPEAARIMATMMNWEPREAGRVYRIVDASMDRVKQAA